MRFILITILSIYTLHLSAQENNEDQLLRDGNDLYKEKNYKAASDKYTEAAKGSKYEYVSTFNLGDAFYQLKEYEKAEQQYQIASQLNNDPKKQANAYHNLGNAQLKQNKYKEAVESYKEALRHNPTDNDTRHNLSYAMKKLIQQQQQQQNDEQNKDGQNDDKDQQQNEKDKNGDQNKDGNKGEDDEKKDGDKKDSSDSKDGDKKKKDQDKNAGKDGDQDEAQPESQDGNISKEEAEKLLNAIDSEEADLRKSLKLQEKKTEPKVIEKDW